MQENVNPCPKGKSYAEKTIFELTTESLVISEEGEKKIQRDLQSRETKIRTSEKSRRKKERGLEFKECGEQPQPCQYASQTTSTMLGGNPPEVDIDMMQTRTAGGPPCPTVIIVKQKWRGNMLVWMQETSIP